MQVHLPPPPDVDTPDMEWWDIAFLSKQNRENNNLQYKVRPSNICAHSASQAVTFCIVFGNIFAQLCSINNSKTLAYVEVPGAVAPLGEVQVPDTLPLMHTKRVGRLSS